MLTAHLTTILTRELRALAREIRAYPDDASVWKTTPGAQNPGGTLALHLAGNIQHYIGAVLGGSAYKRDRPAEFSRRGLSRDELVAEVEQAIAAVERTLPAVQQQTLAADFPEAVGGKIIRTDEFLLHIATHLGWHLGQLDYHRRMVTGDAGKIGAIAVTELGTARPAAA